MNFRHFRYAGLFLLGSQWLWAEPVVQEPPAAPQPAAPFRTPRPDPKRFAGEIAKFADQPLETGGIVFTGSSSIRLWSGLKQDFPGLPVVNRGFGGCVSNDMVTYFDTIVGKLEPKLIVTYSGSNDLNEKLTVDEAFGDYEKFLTMSHQRFPYARVIVTSVKIAPRRVTEIPMVSQLNDKLQQWCKAQDWVVYVDCTSYLEDRNKQPIATFYREDQLHLNDAGYAQWKAILEPVVREQWLKVK